MYSVDRYAISLKAYLNLNMIWCYFMEAVRWPYAMTQKTMCSSAYEWVLLNSGIVHLNLSQLYNLLFANNSIIRS